DLRPQGLAPGRRLAVDVADVALLDHVREGFAEPRLRQPAGEGLAYLAEGALAVEVWGQRDVELPPQTETALLGQQHQLAFADDVDGKLRAEADEPGEIDVH